MTKEEIIKAAKERSEQEQNSARVIAAQEILKEIKQHKAKLVTLEKELDELPDKVFHIRQDNNGESSFRFGESSFTVSGWWPGQAIGYNAGISQA